MKKLLIFALLSCLVCCKKDTEHTFKLYGMTNTGGANNMGVLFEYNVTTGAYTKKHDFGPSQIGINPQGSLSILNKKLYGMTSGGGSSSNGILFEYNLVTNVYTKMHDFGNGTDGRYPHGGLTVFNRKLYGLTSNGGANMDGILFEYDPVTESYTKKYDFGQSVNNEDGIAPVGNLTLFNGRLYGITNTGGNYNSGVLFEYNPANGIYTKKYDFAGGNDGAYPEGSLTAFNGKLYGMTYEGGTADYGILYEYDPATNVYTKKHDFNPNIENDGRRPFGNLTAFGLKLYGMTNEGGVNDMGVLFEYNPTAGIYTKKFDFETGYGYWPYGTLTVLNKQLYGMTSSGGVNGNGVLFAFTPLDNSYNLKFNFSGQSNPTPGGGALYTQLLLVAE